ncbi:MAG: MarC family protein [Candidatus Omnitrophota bacterium]
MENILLAFIPIFVAVDAIGLLPIFVGLTQELERKERISIIVQSLITAGCLAIGFILVGRAVFKFLGITIGDFMVAGGAILFCLAVIDLVLPNKPQRIPPKELGVVPLGTPLIVGPAVLTTSLIMIGEHGLYATFISILANLVLVGLFFMTSGFLIKVLGEAGSRALSKVTSLLLAAIAVMMIRKGVMHILTLQ